jgi:uncharacterized protein (DUF427 family)
MPARRKDYNPAAEQDNIVTEQDNTTRTPMKLPGPDHPITIEPCRSRVIVSVATIKIVDSVHAIFLREANYPPVLYIPRGDADMSRLTRSERATYCPYKGDCSYYSIAAGGPKSIDAVWTYEHPYEAVAQIEGHLAFYPDRVDSVEITDPPP